MCGITGIVDMRGERPIDEPLLRAMNGVIGHRGPDGDGFHFEPGVGFGHRRLSIIDLEGGKQPLYNEDHTVVVTYNGEIFNFMEVERELLQRGHTFRTRSDTEVIVHAWEEWGVECLKRFNGMFAFAVWDRRAKTLFIARDRLGVKPLYYAELSDGRLIFGSELKALLLHPLLQRRIDPQAVEEYFAFGYVPDPKTIYRDVKKLEPGAYICMKRGDSHVKPVRYWDVPLDGERALEQPAAAWEEELRARLKEAVRKRLVSDVPLGAFLSGGIDSSAVVAMMREIGAGHILTCSIGFDEPRYDESSYARMVAEAKHTDHKAEIVATSDYSLVDRLVGIYDEPYADSSAIPTYRVCELARRHVTVALSGDGGDENLIGYRRYKLFAMEEQVRSRVPLGLRKAIFGPLGSLYPKLDWAPRVLRGKTTFQALARDAVAAYFHGVSICSNEMRAALFSHEFRRELQGYGAEEVFRQHVRGKTFNDPLKMIQYLDFKTYLPGDILTKVDRASMAHSLEVRTPFLDYELVEWVASLPSAIKLKGGEGKHILKRSLEPLLPREVLYRNKMGFAVPLDVWFRGSLRDHIAETVRGRRLAESGLFNPATLARIVADHQSGRRDHSAILWSLLMFDGFLRQNATPGVVPELVTRLSGAA
ncbi:MAG TPA: XrtA/PEP-CTERM system amidotransferase [Steroidobacteraceae bacterium]|jgi:asparagine synthase (glutamine-hydrolysing)|nr:XrtA/PEP-CTERM system amidotransferase [Steroidobacteraceae bacterium]